MYVGSQSSRQLQRKHQLEVTANELTALLYIGT